MHAVLTHPTILAFVDESMPNDVCYWVRNCNPSFPSAVIRNKVNGLISSFGALLHNTVPKVSAELIGSLYFWLETFGQEATHIWELLLLISYLKSFGISSTEIFHSYNSVSRWLGLTLPMALDYYNGSISTVYIQLCRNGPN